ARGGKIVERLVGVGELLDRQHVDGADQLAITVVGKERTGRQGRRVHEELTQAGQEVGQLHQAADGLVGVGGRRLGDVVRNVVSKRRQRTGGKQGKGDGKLLHGLAPL